MTNLTPTFQIFKNGHIPRLPILRHNNDSVIRRAKITIELVTGLAFEKYNVRSRNRQLAFSRQLFFYLVRENSTLSLREVGEQFSYNFYYKLTGKMGKRWYDHSTVIHGIKTINDLMEGYPSQEKKQILAAIEKFKEV
jgi:chromosomal replication initiation ATPase DnaA